MVLMAVVQVANRLVTAGVAFIAVEICRIAGRILRVEVQREEQGKDQKGP
jgi:hypothetical protein